MREHKAEMQLISLHKSQQENGQEVNELTFLCPEDFSEQYARFFFNLDDRLKEL
jgi:hypothetical protein